MKTVTTDVVVIGAGVIGCAVARELAVRGRDVIVVERNSPGRRASWAAAGMLSPLGEAGGGPFLELCDTSLHRFASFAHALREETGIDIEYRTNGKLHVSLGDHDSQLAALASGPLANRFEVSLLDGASARALEPALSDAITTALLIGRDHRVNNRLLAQALLAAATAKRVRFMTAAPAAALVTRGHTLTGVRLMSGEQINAAHVVLAAGAWSGSIEGLPRALPIRPVKGQMFAVDGRARDADRTSEPAIERTLLAATCYILPREDGRLLVGATMEETGFRKGPTPRGIATLMHAAMQVVPALAEMPLVETWAGFRPATPDGLPVLGADPDVRGLIYATGHFRNGILLTPITATSVADLVSNVSPSVDLAPFAVTRFASSRG